MSKIYFNGQNMTQELFILLTIIYIGKCNVSVWNYIYI